MTAEQKLQATGLYKSLQLAESLIRQGTRDTEQIISQMRQCLSKYPAIAPDYISIVDTETLKPVGRIDCCVLIALAANVGKSRLVDNIIVDVGAL